MKTGLTVFVAAIISVAVLAEDVVLKDGRVLKDATVVAQAPRKVTIKHAAGLASVAKELLPEKLQTQYPINEAAARAADERAVVELKAAQESRKVEAERLALARTQRDANLAANNTAAEKEAARIPRETETVKADAKHRAETYFASGKYSENPATNETCTVTISEVRQLEGWSGRWFVKGQAAIKHYDDYRNRLNGILRISHQWALPLRPPGTIIGNLTTPWKWWNLTTGIRVISALIRPSISGSVMK